MLKSRACAGSRLLGPTTGRRDTACESCSCQHLLAVEKKVQKLSGAITVRQKKYHFEIKRIPTCQESTYPTTPNLQFLAQEEQWMTDHRVISCACCLYAWVQGHISVCSILKIQKVHSTEIYYSQVREVNYVGTCHFCYVGIFFATNIFKEKRRPTSLLLKKKKNTKYKSNKNKIMVSHPLTVPIWIP